MKFYPLFFLLFFASCAPRAHERPHTSSWRAQPIKIAIDAGHGGHDSGSKLIIAPYTQEKMLTLQTAKAVDDLLTNWGYDTFLTRQKDIFVPLQQRSLLARKNHCTLFVSIHYNSTPKPTKASGVEVYYYTRTNPHRSKASKTLASSIANRVSYVSKNTSRGVKPGDFAVIRETNIPAVLVEVEFLSNPNEAKKLSNKNYIELLSWAIAKGVEDHIRNR